MCHPYLQNINQDPQLSGIVKFCLEPGEGWLGGVVTGRVVMGLGGGLCVIPTYRTSTRTHSCRGSSSSVWSLVRGG